ncbi:MAG: hypothetical protein AB8B74_13235 [Crocinitomicaceae bacterium]
MKIASYTSHNYRIFRMTCAYHYNAMIKLLLLFILTLIGLNGHGQSDTKELNLNKYYFDVTVSRGFYKPIKKEITNIFGADTTVITSGYEESGFGLESKVGNNWYFNKGPFCGVVSLTWLRVGFIFSDGLFLYASPLNIGLGHHFQVSKKVSIEPMVHAGAVFIVDDIIDLDGFVDYFVMPELRFYIDNFTLGLEYTSRRALSSKNESLAGHYHFFGASIGISFNL